MITSSFEQILPLVFPIELLEAFEITEIRISRNARTDDETVHIHLEEKNAPPPIPPEHRGKRIMSKGFDHPRLIQDFPIRSRLCALHIKPRRWEIEDAGSLKRTLTFLPDSGMKLTTDFAAFLKEADRTRAGGGRTHRETLLGG